MKLIFIILAVLAMQVTQASTGQLKMSFSCQGQIANKASISVVVKSYLSGVIHGYDIQIRGASDWSFDRNFGSHNAIKKEKHFVTLDSRQRGFEKYTSVFADERDFFLILPTREMLEKHQSPFFMAYMDLEYDVYRDYTSIPLRCKR